MWNAIVDGAMPRFWPPRPNRFWNAALEPWRYWYLRRYYKIAEVAIDRPHEFGRQFAPGDGVLLAPNHSHDSDPHVMMQVGRRLGRQLHFMAAWQIFRPHWGLDGWILQRMGAFSVDREGCDRRALKQATEILTTGRSLVVFPEGEVYRLNDRLTPLLDGVAFMALSAQRELTKTSPGRRVWIVPTAAFTPALVSLAALMLTMEIWLAAQRWLSSVGRVALLPGLVLQRLTTREPKLDDTRVALRAVAGVLAADRAQASTT